MIYLSDTNILINALNNKRGHRALLNRLVLEGNRLSCCTVVLAEVYSGIRPSDLSSIDTFLSAFEWYPPSPSIARRAGRLRFDYSRQEIALSLADTLIAATAIEHGLTLITGNRKHFPMPELQLYPLPQIGR